MLCDNCKQKPAAVHTVMLINGQKRELYLCSECARARGIGQLSLMDLISGFGDFSNHGAVCPVCGTGIDALSEDGVLGCPECYNALASELSPIIKKAQGGATTHIGRRTAAVEQDELTMLKQQIQEAVAKEDYERAATLRDRIRTLEQGRDDK